MKRLLSFVTVLLLCQISGLLAQNAPHSAGYLYLSPMPQAQYVSDQTRFILVRFTEVSPYQITNLTNDFITVTGYLSGTHTGLSFIAIDGRTVIFQMDEGFTTNELVTVSLNPELSQDATGTLQPYTYQFAIDSPMPGALPISLLSSGGLPMLNKQSIPPEAPDSAQSRNPATPRPLAGPMTQSNGVSVPSDFPQVVITVNSNPSPGVLFLENGLNGVPPYTMIMDNNGLPVWYRRGRMYDFKIQKNGMITWCLSDDTGFPAFDQNFNYYKTYLTTNGYSTDGHELKIMPDGTYFMIGYQYNLVDMSQYTADGTPNTLVRETVVQEFTAADELIFQWRAWDNYDLADEYGNTDFPHMNGIDIDEDGNILVSARHLSEVTKINKDSGEIIWRLSGAHSTFKFVNDEFNGTSFQHNISVLSNSHYMVFDNGNVPEVSRAAEYLVDLTNLTATLVWEFRDNPDKFAYYMGSAQRLTNGNTLIDFVMAQYPKVIEVDTNGVKHFELSMVPGSDSYRAFRLPWHGVVAAPYLVADPQPNNLTLVFNKFGDTNIAYYRIYGGLYQHPTNVLAESVSTLKEMYLKNGFYYFRVTAVGTDGTESPFSNEESVYVNIIQPGQNMVQNADFSSGYSSWGFFFADTGNATSTINNGTIHFSISNGGLAPTSIQLDQFDMGLVQGNEYILDFDAWSTQTRYIQASVAQIEPPYLDYSQLPFSFLTPNPTHFRYIFTMQQPSDFSAALVFNLGASTADVYLQNISLFTPPVGDLNLDGTVNYLDLGILVGNWLKQQSGLAGDLDQNGKVDFNDFNLLGGNWDVDPP